MQEIFEAAKVIVTLIFLLYASWSDYKTREVTNRVWIAYAPIAFALSISELLLYNHSRLILFGLSVGITVAIAFALFYSGGFGGADSKALMCIALALPFAPTTIFSPLLASGISPLSQNIFPLTILSNSVLIAAFSAVAILLYNLFWRIKNKENLFEDTLTGESIWKKLLVLLTGYRVSITKLKEKWHVYPLEDIGEENETNTVDRKLIVVPTDAGRDEIVARLVEAISAGKIGAKVWATPGLPMLIFVTIGFVVALLFGDVVWSLISLIFR